MGKFIDLTGQRFGRLAVIERSGSIDGGAAWTCQCSCKNKTKKVISGKELRRGDTKSCGCIKIELARQTIGYARKFYTMHGGTVNKKMQSLYGRWDNTKERISNPRAPGYCIYGGKGVRICETWEKHFEAYRDYMLDLGYTDDCWIERIDKNGHFEPGNIKLTYPLASK
ncbi:hypothetical protein AGMMS49940_15410 [Spirochaetia bacterium]|nr:hypothetical protein AGMMS49940_15410 [Spirochaetia bacterium]